MMPHPLTTYHNVIPCDALSTCSPHKNPPQALTHTLNPYVTLSRHQWAQLRGDTPLTITESEAVHLQSFNDPLSLDEVISVYLPLARLLSLYVQATQDLAGATQRFLADDKKTKQVPYIIGIAGSVAAGKSTTARLLQALLARGQGTPRVDLVTTDGFLYPNTTLENLGLMDRKGFPESYNLQALLNFLADVKSGAPSVTAPVYSHLYYDIVPDTFITVEQPDILIVEGLNVLQPARLPKNGDSIPFVSDFFDISIYVDASEATLKEWYITRFLGLRETTFNNPNSYFHTFTSLSEISARAIARDIWERINAVNLRENILPTRQRASLILHKDDSHRVQHVALRRL
jgi:type I pantothenate kinase